MQSKPVTRMIEYGDSKGFLASSESSQPCVIMIHEWWGLNDHIKEQAALLAGKGYTVLAIDLYDGLVATNPQEAMKLATGIDAEEALGNMRSAIDYLEKTFNPRKIASLGWCFGGGMSMQLAVSRANLDATVIYYGNLVTDQNRLSMIKWPVLGIFGEQDKTVTPESVAKFEEALNKLKIRNEIYMYAGVGHAFANPSNPGHDKKKADDAWEKTLKFLDKNLK